jgi:F-type H+-transporting ATPase subunit delta
MADNHEADFQHQADVGTQRVAKVYAEALLNAAEKQNQATEVLEDLQGLVGEVFRANPLIETLLTSAAVGRQRKAELLRQTFDGRVSETFSNFLQVLNEHDRLELVRPVCVAYRALFDERAGRVRVQVRTAVPLPEDQRERLYHQVREALHREPQVEARVDPDLLGGIVIQVGDWLYDASVKARLEDLRNEIIEKGSHEIQSGRNRFSSAV